ncbi:GD21804 [Drosophila simulans]|uniref:GD21804 n=1 Tax=Drosophila simulans TaxID=7240 RepID=B4Q8Z3_DROSI|nr:GD21804 [Drosophila simulans]
MESFWQEVKSLLKTVFCFVVAMMLVPLLLLSFLCAHFGNELSNYVLSIKYPNLTISKSKKIRTLIDTPKNAGVFHFLLQVEGDCDFERIRMAYAQHLTDLRDKTGMLRFPKLRQKLVTCWGHYAWVNDSSGFNINNHVLLSTHKYRGRPVSESNIQEYVSELATKYIPSDLPQWQVIVIPNSDSTQPYYILIKLHHLIIAEEEDLHVSEMLLLQDPHKKTTMTLSDGLDCDSSSPKLSRFVRKPEHISRLINHIIHLIICRWQKFIYEFESLETPDGSTSSDQVGNLSQLVSLVVIVLVNVILGYIRSRTMLKKLKKRSVSYRNEVGRFQTIRLLLNRELDQRNLNWSVARNAVYKSLQPTNLVKALTRFLWRLNLNHVVLLPYHIYCEFLAFGDVVIKGDLKVPNYLNTTCRTIDKGYFTDRSGDKSENIGGVVFLQLPLRQPDANHTKELHQIVERIRKQQIIIYLASIGQTKYSLLTSLLPHVITKIFINFFSYNFPITITEIYGATAEFQAAWGQKVEDVLLFRPPQSKTCLSLNLHRFGDKYRLAVMADTHLAPDHTVITRSFEQYMETITL